MKLSDQITRRHLFVAFGTSSQSGTLSSVDLVATRDDASVALTASDGSVAPIAGADASTAGVMTAADKVKLDSLPPALTQDFDAAADVPVAAVDAAITHLRTAGYAAAGDGGAAVYHRVATEPAHTGKVQSADGAWWELLRTLHHIPVERFGAVGDGVADDGPAIKAAIEYANSTEVRQNHTASSWNGQPRPTVSFTKGRNYLIDTTVALNDELAQVDLVCAAGRANLIGSGTKAVKGITCDRMDGTTFRGLNFINFLTAVEGDTNNVNGALITFEQCDFLDCTKGVDTRSFAQSRSTVLRFDRCRANGTARLVDSYCDLLEFFGGFFQSADGNQAFVKADSLVTVVGGAWVPPLSAIGEKARWFDLHASETATRGFVAIGARFSPENGGIPVVYNYAAAHDVSRDRIGPHIQFLGGKAASSNSTTGRGVVVLADDGAGGSIAPNHISVKGTMWHASGVGFVRTESGSPVNLGIGRFVIDIDQAAEMRLADSGVAPTTPLVEVGLERYLARHGRIWSDLQISSETGSDVTLDAGLGRTIRLNQGSPTTITGIVNVFDGDIVRLVARNGNVTVQDASVGGAIYLNGATNFAMSAHSTLTLQWDRAAGLWTEIARSAR